MCYTEKALKVLKKDILEIYFFFSKCRKDHDNSAQK